MTSARLRGRPGEEVHPPGDRHRAAVRVLPRRRDEHAGGALRQPVHEQPAVVDRDRDRLDPEPLERAPEVRADGSSIASVRPSASHSRAAVANAPCAPAVTTICSGVARTARDIPR